MDDLEERVWQRIAAPGPCRQGAEDLIQLQHEALEMSEIYGRLRKNARGRSAQLLQRLQEGEQANAACLRGIGRILGSDPGKPGTGFPGQELPRRALEKCYHRTRRARLEYTARSAEPEFGPVFHNLAEREAAHAVLLAELLGSMER